MQLEIAATSIKPEGYFGPNESSLVATPIPSMWLLPLCYPIALVGTGFGL